MKRRTFFGILASLVVAPLAVWRTRKIQGLVFHRDAFVLWMDKDGNGYSSFGHDQPTGYVARQETKNLQREMNRRTSMAIDRFKNNLDSDMIEKFQQKLASEIDLDFATTSIWPRIRP